MGGMGWRSSNSRDIVIRRNESRDHNRYGIVVVATTGAVLEENLVAFCRAIAGIGVAVAQRPW